MYQAMCSLLLRKKPKITAEIHHKYDYYVIYVLHVLSHVPNAFT